MDLKSLFQKFLVLTLLFVSVGTLSSITVESNSTVYPKFLSADEVWADAQLEKMTLEQKIGQFFMVATWPYKGEKHEAEIDSIITNYEIGGLIYFQGEKEQTKNSIKAHQAKSKVPLLIGIDAEWGAGMRIYGFDRFPYHMTMGAANEVKVTEKISEAIAYEMQELGVHINFAPVADVNSNPNNPVISFRSFGENPLLVGNHTMAFVKGHEKNNVMSCMKHFPGHGDTDKDSHLELPTVNHDKRTVEMVDLLPFKMANLGGVSSVMMAHLNVPALDSTGTPTSLSRTVIQDHLQGRMKFEGLVISDALNMKGVADKYGKTEVVIKAFEAGIDILLFPESVGDAIQAIKKKVENREISEEELNARCKKVLLAKKHTIINALPKQKLNSFEIEYAKRQVYENAITVLENKNDAIPFGRLDKKIACIGIGTNANHFEERVADYAKTDNYHFYSGEEASARMSGKLDDYDIIMINIHSNSIWPGNGFHYPKGWQNFLGTLPKEATTTVSFFGNPYVISDNSDFTNVDAVLVGYENHALAQDFAAQLLFGAIPANGKLPVSLSDKYQVGHGVKTEGGCRLKYTVPEEVGAKRSKLKELDQIAEKGIKDGAYPGCQIVAAKEGKVFYQKSFGAHTYDSSIMVKNTDIYDLASITKIGSSTLSLMSLQTKSKDTFSLDKRLKDYIPEVTGTGNYGNILLRDMLTHQARLKPWIPFYTRTIDSAGWKKDIYGPVMNDTFSVRVADSMFITKEYEQKMYDRILGTSFLRRKKYKYSDLGYYFAKKIIEKKVDTSLNVYVQDNFYKPMGLQTMTYHPLNYFPKNRITPTENDTIFRKQLVHGHVHDPGAAMTGGVGGHAGLFSSATDLAALMQMYLNKGNYGGVQYINPDVIKEFTGCQFCPTNRRGAGFDKPVRSLDGGPTCELVSLKSFGHSGFTGTLAWADPVHKINYVFLSNRVYPSAENWKIVRQGIRTEIQRCIYESLQ